MNLADVTSDAPKRRGRPATAPQDAATYQRLIRAGLVHLTERGYSAVGLDMILTLARVPKGSFYHYFPNKAAFGRAAIAAYRAYFVAKMERHLSDDSLAPLARVAAFAAAAEAGMARQGFRRGCLIGNLGQEMGALPEEFRADLIATLEDWQARLARVLQIAQNQGEISPHHNPADLAQMFWIGWEGAVLRAKLERGPAPLRLFAAQFLAQLNTTPKGDAPCSMPS